MSNTTIENVTSTADRLKLALAVLVIIAGIVGFSVLESKIPMVGRIAVFIGSLPSLHGLASLDVVRLHLPKIHTMKYAAWFGPHEKKPCR
jgi:hypothetical protein